MQEVEFLTGKEYGEAIRDILRTSRLVDMAVSYWGQEILNDLEFFDRTKDSENGSFRVICDLGHVACRWQPINELIKSKVCVKRMNGLHAKVWIGQDQVIIGSANSSKTALHMLDSGHGNVEAGLKVTYGNVVEEAKNWFKGLWACDQVKCITKQDMKEKREFRQSNQNRTRQRFSSDHLPKGQRPFEYFVGDRAARLYRDRLSNLDFVSAGPPGNLSINWDEISDIDNFSEDLVRAIDQLLDEAEDIDTTRRSRPPLPQGFRKRREDANHILYEKIADFVENRGGVILWLKSRRENSYSLRLAHTTPDSDSIAVLTIRPDRLHATQNR